MSAEIYEYLLFAQNYLDINCDFHRPSGIKQLFKTLTNSCLRLLQIVPVMLNYFSISYIYVYIHLMFSCENISFVCVANSPTVHAIDSFSIRYFPLENISFACSMLTVSASRIVERSI